MDVKNTQEQFQKQSVTVPLEIIKRSGHQITLQKPFEIGYDIYMNQVYTPKRRQFMEKSLGWKMLMRIHHPLMSVDHRQNKNFKFNFDDVEKKI
jgi:hypothetical protein